MRLTRPHDEPARAWLTWPELWEGADQGLIACWERGRILAVDSPALAVEARAGALVVLPWKGGLETALKSGRKFGSLNYLAMWQGLRGDDLDVDTTAQVRLVCTRFDVRVTFTSDRSKFQLV